MEGFTGLQFGATKPGRLLIADPEGAVGRPGFGRPSRRRVRADFPRLGAVLDSEVRAAGKESGSRQGGTRRTHRADSQEKPNSSWRQPPDLARPVCSPGRNPSRCPRGSGSQPAASSRITDSSGMRPPSRHYNPRDAHIQLRRRSETASSAARTGRALRFDPDRTGSVSGILHSAHPGTTACQSIWRIGKTA